jgi:hypothetical protein
MTNTDLSTQTPREIDTQLSELYLAEMKAKQARSMTLERIHSAIGERAQYMSRNRKAWPKSDTDAIAEARRIADPNAQANYRPCTPNPRGAFDALAKLDETNTTLAEIRERTAVLDAEYARRPWSRFFIVQNNNGHIHSSMNCKTCYVTTGFGWLPELSGKTEADAVRDHGTVLCSVCFPSAPVEWTVGKAKPAGCTGTAVAGTSKRQGMRTYAKCSECGENQYMNADGSLRKHKPKKAA